MNTQIKELIQKHCQGNTFVENVIFDSGLVNQLNSQDIFQLLFIHLDIKRNKYLINNSSYNYFELKDFLNQKGLFIILQGLDQLETYINNEVSLVEALRQSDDIMKERLKDQLFDLAKNETSLIKVPDLYSIFKNKDAERLQTFMKIAMDEVLNNCMTVNYKNNFIENGLTISELLSCSNKCFNIEINSD
jgi:hypothetical protein